VRSGSTIRTGLELITTLIGTLAAAVGEGASAIRSVHLALAPLG
jgi:hypothetical protein